jgi:hypothetical protein
MSISDTTGNLVKGGREIDLSAMAEKTSGAWAPGWYPAEVIEGFVKSGHQFNSETQVSQKGDSFNFRLCFRIANGEELRTDFKSINYRVSDFSEETIITVHNLRKEFAGQGGSWVGFTDQQRSSLALSQLGQIQNATGFTIKLGEDGAINPTQFIGSKLFVRLKVDAGTGYNEINSFSKYPNGVAPKAKKVRGQ